MDSFEHSVELAWPLAKWRRHKICLAVSGGADSVALLSVMVAMALRENLLDHLIVCHVDHGLRGEESKGDALFVRDLCDQFGLKFQLQKIPRQRMTDETRRLGSLEAAARELRYELLLQTAQTHGARFLATAHNQNDQLETIIHRIFRGTGGTGLMAMAPLRPLNDAVVLVRPLLEQSREEIVEYLHRKQLAWRTDSSNAQPDYTRNRIRNELVPLLDDLFPDRWRSSLLRLSSSAASTQNFIDHELDLRCGSVKIDSNGHETMVSLEILRTLPPRLLCEFFRRLWRDKNWRLGEMGQTQWNRLTNMVLRYSPKKISFPGGIVVTCDRDSNRLIFHFPSNG